MYIEVFGFYCVGHLSDTCSHVYSVIQLYDLSYNAKQLAHRYLLKVQRAGLWVTTNNNWI